jgi:lysine 2,3-aminomutase
VPQFVIDSPGGGGKVPLLPEYVESITDDEVIFRNYEGKRYTYKQPKQVPATPNEVERAAELDVVPISRRKTAAPRRTKRRRAAGE